MKLQIVKINDDAIIPTRKVDTDAGLDLYAPESILVRSGTTQLIHTGIKIKLPKGTAGFIFARSGLGTKFGVRPRNCVGVIDETYYGEIIVALENSSIVPYQITKGDRIAQLVIKKVEHPEIEVVDSFDESNDRDGGFGSSGK